MEKSNASVLAGEQSSKTNSTSSDSAPSAHAQAAGIAPAHSSSIPSTGTDNFGRTKLSAAEKQSCLIVLRSRLRSLFATEDNSKWQIGDELIRATDDYDANLADLASEFGQSVSNLSEMRAVGRAWGPHDRDRSIPYNRYLVAYYAEKRTAREKSLHARKEIAPDFHRALAEIRRAEAKTHRHLNKAKATKLLTDQARAQRAALVTVPHVTYSDDILNRCHQIDCNDLLQRLHDNPPSWKIKLGNVDPPYGSYRKTDDGKLDVSTSCQFLRDGNNLDETSAIATTVRSLRLLPALMDRNAPILLWQAGNRELRRPILDVLEEVGWVVEMPVICAKKKVQPADFVSAWSIGCEICWVLKRKGDEILNHDGSTRHNVLDAELFQLPNEPLSVRHLWQKPIGLMEFFINKHSDRGDVVMDLYGCSGSASIAAIRNDRRFIYCESFAQNFETFAPEVLRTLQAAQEGRLQVASPHANEANADALAVLTTLGEKRSVAAALLDQVKRTNPNATTEELVRAALTVRAA